MDEEGALGAKLAGLEKLMELGFKEINRRLDDMCSRMVETGRFDALEARVSRTEVIADELDERVDKNSRVVWLIGIVTPTVVTILGGIVVYAVTRGWIG